MCLLAKLGIGGHNKPIDHRLRLDMTIHLLALSPLVLSAVAAAWLLRGPRESRSEWVVRCLASASIVVFTFLAGPWALTSYYLRYLFPAFYAAVAISSFRRLGQGGPGSSGRPRPGRRRLLVPASVFLLFSMLILWTIPSVSRREPVLEASFPLRHGVYCVLQGGGGLVTNPFHTLSGNPQALDIVKLNRFGNRASGLAPGALGAYEIFGEAVLSPCDGRVLATRDGLADNPPGEPETRHRQGNYVVLGCSGTEVSMAHMLQGSIAVCEGETVQTGQMLARVGNSGNTLEPHLHIDAKTDEKPTALNFGGRTLSINRLVVSRASRL